MPRQDIIFKNSYLFNPTSTYLGQLNRTKSTPSSTLSLTGIGKIAELISVDNLSEIGSSVKLDWFSSKTYLVYQLMALGLLTLALILGFQNFTNTAASQNIIVQSKQEMQLINQNRIWTDSTSIDGINEIPNFTVSSVAAETLIYESNKQALASGINPGFKEVKVKSGDTLSSISAKNKVDINELAELNNLTSSNLRIGQTLLLPPSK